MAKFTISIREDTIAEALAAATRLNQSLPERQRQPEPITFSATDAEDAVYGFLHGTIIQEAQQAAQVAAEKSLVDTQNALQTRRRSAPQAPP